MIYQHGRQVGRISIDKFNLVVGVILPALAITVEANTNLSARMFFDPIPTGGHLLLVLLVPLAQLHVWFAIRRNDPNRLRLAGVANAVAITISLFYSLVYLPLVPIAALTLFIVLGFLLLSPFFSLVAAVLMRHQLMRLAATATKRSFPLTKKGLLAGIVVTGALISLLELPPAFTRYGLQLATSNDPQTKTRGIEFLRAYGSKDYLLRRCYSENSGSLYLLSQLFSSDRVIKVDEVRDIYYRVTGEPFDASPPPQRIGNRQIQQKDLESEDNFDGTRTTGIFKDLSLSSSNLSGSFDADGGVGHLDWTLAFDNASSYKREVRAEIQLPPGAVVSSVSQTSKGIERDSDFTGRMWTAPVGEVHPSPRPGVWVTTAGRDRILVQYPVRGFSKGDSVRIGITVPLVLQTKEQARLILPHFNARNFHVPDSLKHWILIDSTTPLSSDLSLSIHTSDRSYNMGFRTWGNFTDAELMRPESALRLSRNPIDHGIWSYNHFEAYRNSIVKQSIEERTPTYLRRIVVVVDTSVSMRRWKVPILSALLELRSDVEVQLILADGDWRYKTDRGNTLAVGFDNAYTLLGRKNFVGGADNVPALNLAWDMATSTPGNNAIVWIHSPQRATLESVEPLIDRLHSRYDGPSLYAVQTSAGSDEIEKRLDGIDAVKSVVRLGSLRSDLERLFSQLTGNTPTLQFVRSVKTPSTDLRLEGAETSDHLARLWANDEVGRILSARDNSLREPATMLSLRYSLVTPASGAVIQDRWGWFDDSELAPPDLSPFATVLQPDFGSLLFLALIFFVWLVYVKVTQINAPGVPTP